jgi:DNA-binding Xre family transcriptional regulator
MHDHPTPAELRGLPRSSYARSHAVDPSAATETLGQRLRRLRVARGWTQRRLEREAALCNATVSSLERGEQPMARTLGALARALEVSMDALWYGAPE